MAKLLVRCMGQASDPDIKYLYKDGAQKVLWDNSGLLKPAPSYISDGTVTETDSSFIFPMPAVGHSRSLVTNSVVDLSGYSALKILTVVNHIEHTYSLDISALNGSYYVVLATLDDHVINLYASTTKDSFGSNYAKATYFNVGHYPVTVSRIWIEK